MPKVHERDSFMLIQNSVILVVAYSIADTNVT